jgi:putative membrane protein
VSSAAPPEPARTREHLANERTLLAWVRTAIAFMGLGFVVARFGLFLRQVALERSAAVGPESSLAGYIGIGMVAVGLLATVLSAIRFLRVRAQIDAARFEPEIFPEAVIVTLTLLGGALLVVYLALNR